jgi:hypothetical protein
MTKSKKTELFRNYFKKGFIQKRRETEKNEEKTKPYLKLTFITAMCIEERDGMLYVFYRQQII